MIKYFIISNVAIIHCLKILLHYIHIKLDVKVSKILIFILFLQEGEVKRAKDQLAARLDAPKESSVITEHIRFVFGNLFLVYVHFLEIIAIYYVLNLTNLCFFHFIIREKIRKTKK